MGLEKIKELKILSLKILSTKERYKIKLIKAGFEYYGSFAENGDGTIRIEYPSYYKYVDKDGHIKESLSKPPENERMTMEEYKKKV